MGSKELDNGPGSVYSTVYGGGGGDCKSSCRDVSPPREYDRACMERGNLPDHERLQDSKAAWARLLRSERKSSGSSNREVSVIPTPEYRKRLPANMSCGRMGMMRRNKSRKVVSNICSFFVFRHWKLICRRFLAALSQAVVFTTAGSAFGRNDYRVVDTDISASPSYSQLRSLSGPSTKQ